MRSAWVFLFLLLLGATSLSAQPAATPTSQSAQTERSLVFVDLPDAPGKLDRERVRTCLSLLVQELNLGGEVLPHVVVIHADRKLSDAAGVNETMVRRIASVGDGHEPYYEFWIVEKPTFAVYTAALHEMLEHHFAIKHSESERQQIMARVLRTLNNTVSAQ